MERLFDISSDFAELFDRFDEIQEMEFDKDESGQYVDGEGNVVNPDTYRADMLQAWLRCRIHALFFV